MVNLVGITLYQMYVYCYPEQYQRQIKISDGLSPLPTFIETALLTYAFHLMQQCGGMRYQVSQKQMILQIGANSSYCLSQIMSTFATLGTTYNLICDITVVCASAFTLIVLIFSMTEIAKIQLNYEQSYFTKITDEISELSRSDINDVEPLLVSLPSDLNDQSMDAANAVRIYSESFRDDSISVSMVRMMESKTVA